MSPEPSRRRLLGRLAAAASVGIGAGCLGTDSSELRVRNFSGTARHLRVVVENSSGETLIDNEYELDTDEQATEKEVYDSAETYVVTVTVNDEITSSEITVDDPGDVMTHVTVRDDGVSIGRIAP